MVFSSVIFLFGFLPAFIGLYFLLSLVFPDRFSFGLRLRNLLILLFSILFYAWGEKLIVLVMLFSTLVDYICGLMISRQWSVRSRNIVALDAGSLRSPIQKVGLFISIATNLSLLGFFKYANFFIDNFNAAFAGLGIGDSLLGTLNVTLPLGISFYTFQSMSYSIDVYRGETRATRNLLDFACFVTMFPQLVAGPIVRYRDIAEQLVSRSISLNNFASGIRRFIIGLGKKVLIADIVARSADRIFAIPNEALRFDIAWFGVICYTLQIYFDFSGYSDMAIGMGKMLGFDFPENFRFPYIAQSIQDFWRRWHISLSSWFRDYLYIPLGGSKVSNYRIYLNLVTVFFLCGLWHGASWTFVVWGLFHGFFLVLERLGLSSLLEKTSRPIKHLYVLLVAMFGWVLFRSESFEQAIAFFSAMLGLHPGKDVSFYNLAFYTDGSVLLITILGIIGSLKLYSLIIPPQDLLRKKLGASAVYTCLNQCFYFAVFLLSIAQMSAGTYSPFIYFRF